MGVATPWYVLFRFPTEVILNGCEENQNGNNEQAEDESSHNYDPSAYSSTCSSELEFQVRVFVIEVDTVHGNCYNNSFLVDVWWILLDIWAQA